MPKTLGEAVGDRALQLWREHEDWALSDCMAVARSELVVASCALNIAEIDEEHKGEKR